MSETWPTPQDYQEAIQNPRQNFADEELARGSLVVNQLGLPKVASGTFASVYKMVCGGQPLAVRCFLNSVESQEHRYAQISRFVMSDSLPYTVSFEFQPKGIRVRQHWYPLLKMYWVEGECLDQYIRRHLAQPEKLAPLPSAFKKMVLDLRDAGIAHGDLQHGNIIVVGDEGELQLVDYDGMYVPALAGQASLELGHRNYQHPSRASSDFNDRLDNFSAWSIYASLSAIAADSGLVEELYGLDECLLFRQTDYAQPEKSPAFYAMENHTNAEICKLSRMFRTIVHNKIMEVPFLDETFEVDENLPEVSVPINLGTDGAVRPYTMSDSNSLTADPREYEPAIGRQMVEPEQVAILAQSRFVTSSTGEQYAPPPVHSQDPGPSEAPLWPTVEDYTAALAEPDKSLVCHATWMAQAPVRFKTSAEPIVGSHGVVFKIDINDREMAIKFFLRGNAIDLQERYRSLQTFLDGLQSFQMKHLDKIHYFSEGIKINGQVYPCVLSPWHRAEPLLKIMKTPSMAGRSDTIAFELRNLTTELSKLQVVHGTFEPNNLLYGQGRMKPVDFDATAVPTYFKPSREALPTALRHPKARDPRSGFSDNFAAWVLDMNLLLLAKRPDLAAQGDEYGLILTSQDIVAYKIRPEVQDLLDTYFDLTCRMFLLRRFCELSPMQVPPLGTDGWVSNAWATTHGVEPRGALVIPGKRLPSTLDEPKKTTAVTKTGWKTEALLTLIVCGLYGPVVFMGLIQNIANAAGQSAADNAVYFLFCVFGILMLLVVTVPPVIAIRHHLAASKAELKKKRLASAERSRRLIGKPKT